MLSGPEGVLILGVLKEGNRGLAGRTLADIAEMTGTDWIEAAMDLVLSEEQRVGTIYEMMNEDNVRMQLQQPWMKFGTDAGGADPDRAQGLVHPRTYGTFPRILGRYVREEGVLELEDAVRKASSAVATRLQIRDRGLLEGRDVCRRGGLQPDDGLRPRHVRRPPSGLRGDRPCGRERRGCGAGRYAYGRATRARRTGAGVAGLEIARDGSGLRGRNVLGGELEDCSLSPLTGFYRDGCCNTGSGDAGVHVVCVVTTREFLTFSRDRGKRPDHPQPLLPLSRTSTRGSLVPMRLALEGGARRRRGAARGPRCYAHQRARVRGSGGPTGTRRGVASDP